MKTRLSNWKEESDLYEVVTGKMTDKEALKKVDEKKGINNKVIINPKLKEAIEEIGGEVIGEALAPSKKEINIMKKINLLQLRLNKEKKKTTAGAEKDIAVQQEEVEDIVTSYDPLEAAVEYFYEEGINEEGIDLIIEEVGLDDFVDFVDDSAELLTEERKARKMNVRTLKATQKKAEEIKASKKDVVARGTPSDTLARARAERSLKKRKLAKPASKKEAPTPVKKTAAVVKKARKATVAKARKDFDGDGKVETPKQEHRGVRNKKITKAVAKAKPAQPKKPVSKDGLRAKVKAVYDAGVKRHRKATQPVRVFHKGMKAGAKKTVKFAKDVKKAVVGEEYVDEAKVDKGKSDAEKAEARNKRNTPPGADKDTDLKTFITRKAGESLQSARARVRRQKHDKKHAATRLAKSKERAIGNLKKYDSDGDGKVRVIDAGYKPEGQEVIDEKVSPGVSRQLRSVGRKQRRRNAESGAGRVHTGGSQALPPQHTARSTRFVDTSRDAHTGVDSVSGEYKSAEQRKREHKANVARQRASGASMRGENFSNWRNDLVEKDLSAAERRALPDKEFALPGKGKGPEGKQAGSYPIPDEKHARSALSLVSQHGTPEEKAKVRAKVKKKFPNIDVSEAVKGQDTETRKAMSAERKSGDKRLSPSEGKANADKMERDVKFFDKLTKKAKHTPGSIDESATNPKKFSMKKFARGLEKEYGKGSVISKYTEKPKPQPQKKREPKKDTRTPEQKKADQQKANIDAVYGRTPWNKEGSLGT